MHIERGAWAEINLDAIAHNVQVAKANLKPSTKLCAVVKADAYGHGAVRVAQEAARNGADFLAVALLQEAVKLREAGIDLPILILGSMLPEVADLVVRYDISQAVFDEERLYALNEAALKQKTKAKIHIKIDTGMHRIGVHVRDAGSFAKLAASLPGIEIEGTFSHFATADWDDKEYAAYQFERFQEALTAIEEAGVNPGIRHIANSAALSELQEYQAYERDIPTSNSDTHDFFEQTDTPSHNYTVVIDAGHGGPDPGSIGYKTKVYESNLNLKLSKMLKARFPSVLVKTLAVRR